MTVRHSISDDQARTIKMLHKMEHHRWPASKTNPGDSTSAKLIDDIEIKSRAQRTRDRQTVAY